MNAYRWARRLGFLVLAGLTLLVPESTWAQQTLSLDEAIARAIERSPTLAQRAQALDNAGWTRRTSVASFLPTLNTNTSASLRSSVQRDPNTGELISGSSDSYGAGLSASYTLFEGLSRFRDLDVANSGIAAAEANYTDQRYAVILQTQQQFFAVLRQAELTDVARQRVEQADESLVLTRTRANLRDATASDTLRARLEFVNARQALLQAESALRTARMNLGRQVGVAGPVTPEPPESLDPRALALSDEDIIGLAVSSAPAVLAAEASSVSARASASASKATYFPRVSMSSSYNWSNQVASFNGGSTSWSLGLSASLPIFNGLSREAGVARANETLRVTRMQEEDARLAARAEADAALQALQTAELAIAIAEEALVLAEEDLRVIQERYRVGVARIFDVVQSQIALDDSRVGLVSARYDYVLARAELEAIVGREL